MEPLSLIGFSLFHVTADLLQQIPGGVMGNMAHDLGKVSFTSLVERARDGQVPVNHDLQRAARRSALLATSMLVRQHSLALADYEQRDSVKRWCELLTTHLREEVADTRRDDYAMPVSPMQGKLDQLIGLATGSPESIGGELQRLVIEDQEGYLRTWHDHAREDHRRKDLPPGLLERLREGWAFVPQPPSLGENLFKFLYLRRGRAARAYRFQQRKIAAASSATPSPAPAPAGRVQWFSVFAAFFSEELKANERVKTIFTAKVLSDLKQSAGASDAQVIELRSHFDGSLEGVGREFCAELAKLSDVITSHHDETLAALAEHKSARERDHWLVKSIHGIVSVTQSDVRRVETKVDRLSDQLATATVGENRIPLQRPPRARIDHFVGRQTQLAQLVTRLRAGEERTVVRGPAGFGKTALAAEALFQVVPDEAALARSPFPHGIVFLDLYQARGDLDSALNTLADRLRGGDFQTDASAVDRARLACARRHALVIVEGAEEFSGEKNCPGLADLCDVFSPGETKALILTRARRQAIGGATIVIDETLPPTEAAELLAASARPATLLDSDARTLLDLLHGHPLAITWAGGLLSQNTDHPANLIAEWQSAGLPSLNDPEKRNHTLAWLFERSARHLSPEGLRVLRAAARLAHARFPVAATAGLFPGESPDDRLTAARKVMREFATGGLIRPVADRRDLWSFSHVLAYQFARAAQTDDDRVIPALGHWCDDTIAALLAAKPDPAATVGSPDPADPTRGRAIGHGCRRHPLRPGQSAALRRPRPNRGVGQSQLSHPSGRGLR